MSKEKRKDDVIMNEMITVKEVRCTSDEGTNYGIISTTDALNLAEEMGLDLVLIAPDAKPPSSSPEKQRVPMIVVIGDEEVANKSVALRNRRTREQSNMSKDEFISMLNEIKKGSKI